MDVNGGDLKRLTTHEAHDLDPAWSPDNTRIAFSSDRRLSQDERYFFEIDTMSATGASVARETNGSTVEAHDFSPDWHPYVNQLTFTRSYGADDSDILFVDPATNAISARAGSSDLESAAVYGPGQASIVGDMLWEQFVDGDGDIARATRAGIEPPYLIFEVAGDQLQPDWQPQQDRRGEHQPPGGQRHHRWLQRRQILPDGSGHPRPDGRVPCPRLQSADYDHRLLQRR